MQVHPNVQHSVDTRFGDGEPVIDVPLAMLHAGSPLQLCVMTLVHSRPWPIKPNPQGNPDIGEVVSRYGFIFGLREELADGIDVMLVGPRRMGTTTILRYLCSSPGAGFDAVLVDLEGATSASECLDRMLKALSRNATVWNRTKRVIGDYVDSANLKLGIVDLYASTRDRPPVDLLSNIMNAVDRDLADEDQQLIVALDDVPTAVELILNNEGKEAAQKFLSMLGHLQSSTRSIRWVLAGSVSSNHLLYQEGITEGVLAGFAVRSPRLLTGPDATFLAQRLLEGIDAQPDKTLADRLAELSGRAPFIMHHVARRLHRARVTVTEPALGDATFEASSTGQDLASGLIGVRRLATLEAPAGTEIDSIESLVGAFHGPAGESVDEVVYP